MNTFPLPSGPGTLLELCDGDAVKARAIQRMVVRYGWDWCAAIAAPGGFAEWLAACPGVDFSEGLMVYEQLVPAEVRAAALEHYRDWQRWHPGET